MSQPDVDPPAEVIDHPVYDRFTVIRTLKGHGPDLNKLSVRVEELIRASESKLPATQTIDTEEELSSVGPEQLQILNRSIAAQYHEWARGTEGNKLSLAQVMESLTEEKLKLAALYEPPYLFMLPVTDETSGEVTGFQPVIADGIRQAKSYTYDDPRQSIGVRIQQRYMRPGEARMNKIVYDLLFVAAKKAGKPIDGVFYTMIDDLPEGAQQVPCGTTRDHDSIIYHFPVGWPYPPCHFRSMVKGEVISI